MFQQGTFGQRVQHFGQIGVHPLAFARSENHESEG
jgi:hypothetical protein